MNIETAVSDDETEISTELETLSLEDSEVDNSEGVLSRSEIPEINVAPASPPESSTGFDAKGAEYYFNFKGKKGLDFLDSGYWHRSYAAMVSHSTFQDTLRLARVLDVGCACGAILKGFKDSGIYSAVRGIDPNEYMVQLGRKELGFDENELLAYSGGAFPFHDSCFTLVHVSQVLEHVTEEELDILLAETYRVLMPGGRVFISLDAIRYDETAEKYLGDETHVNIQSTEYWSRKFGALGLPFDIEGFTRYAKSSFGPTHGEDISFFHAYDWSVWILMKSCINISQ